MPVADNSSKSEEMDYDVPDLASLTLEQRGEYAVRLLREQVVEQRKNLHFWRMLTGQPAQIDTGYIAQHLVSIVTGIRGGGFRGKGEDLEDGSEVKSANFLDALDKRGAVAPRWNFTCNDKAQMLGLLEYPAIYLVAMDFNPEEHMRFRVWKLLPQKHKLFKERYEEWMQKLGYPKLSDPKRPGVNFQLFPPKNKIADDYARHGNNRAGGFKRIQVELDDGVGAKLIFHAEIQKGEIILKLLDEWNG
jgi:hypothetical protein